MHQSTREMNRIYWIFPIALLTAAGCREPSERDYPIAVSDPALTLELIAEEPDIVTPIGLTIDERDALYVLESHTHSPQSDYSGPAFDRIKKGVDDDGDGIPERWLIFADSLEDGMNLAYAEEYGVFVTTKNSVLLFSDRNRDGISDERRVLLRMEKPDEVYDHAGILGLACGPDGWVYVSRGNTGGHHWQVTGADGSAISGYGDGGNVFRCRMDGSQLEEVATGFWNPFDIRFTSEGRLLLTDNDPDSRGPNRLIEVVPGGDYGYQSLYGGSGIHPFLSWNGELPGTLPYAAPLGEAPCALMDAGLTNFGKGYRGQVLVSVWEENNIVRIALAPDGSTVKGAPEVLLQGDSLFHPVALAANSRGELYITDWVIRQYPNHGRGKIWRLSAGKTGPAPQIVKQGDRKIDRFAPLSLPSDQLEQALKTGDPFEQALLRHHLLRNPEAAVLRKWLVDEEAELRLQALLISLEMEAPLAKDILKSLLEDPDPRIRRMALVYTGRKGRRDLEPDLQRLLRSGTLDPALFDTFLATVRHLQPAFIEAYRDKAEKRSKDLPRRLPEDYIASILNDDAIDEATKAHALPYLEKPETHRAMLLGLLARTRNESLQQALLNALRQLQGPDLASRLLTLAQDDGYSDRVRVQAIALLAMQDSAYCREVWGLLEAGTPLVQYAAVKYLCRCTGEEAVAEQTDRWINENKAALDDVIPASWDFCQGNLTDQPSSEQEWVDGVNDRGNPEMGRLVFESPQMQCRNCHQVDGWGSSFGPDLSNVGSSKSERQLIHSILQPSLEIAPEWQGWFVTDREGRTHYGRQIDVHLRHVKLMNIDGSFQKYEQPRSYGVADRSLMPEGLQNMLTGEEFNHLIAYLKSLN